MIPPDIQFDDVTLHAKTERSLAVQFAECIDDLGTLKAEQPENGCVRNLVVPGIGESKRPDQETGGGPVQCGTHRGLSDHAFREPEVADAGAVVLADPVQRRVGPGSHLRVDRSRRLDEPEDVGDSKVGRCAPKT